MAYLLDSDVFIQAKNMHYGFDFCPAFWDWLVRENRAGKVYSVEKVFEELNKQQDDLSSWAKDRGRSFFLPLNSTSTAALTSTSGWAMGQDYEPRAVNDFFQKADYFLVAQAVALGYTVVTHEVRAQSKNKIKIPDACDDLTVECISPFEMLRTEGAQFRLGSP